MADRLSAASKPARPPDRRSTAGFFLSNRGPDAQAGKPAVSAARPCPRPGSTPSSIISAAPARSRSPPTAPATAPSTLTNFQTPAIGPALKRIVRFKRACDLRFSGQTHSGQLVSGKSAADGPPKANTTNNPNTRGQHRTSGVLFGVPERPGLPALFQGLLSKKRDAGGLNAKSRSFRPFRDRYCMNQPWLTTADWPLCTVFLAAA